MTRQELLDHLKNSALEDLQETNKNEHYYEEGEFDKECKELDQIQNIGDTIDWFNDHGYDIGGVVHILINLLVDDKENLTSEDIDIDLSGWST